MRLVNDGAHIIYSLKDLLALQDPGNHWLVQNMIPRRGRTIVFGAGGVFKSSVIFDLGIAISCKGMLLRHYPVLEHGPVLIISTEGDIYANRSRILSFLRGRELPSGEGQGFPNLETIPFYFCQDVWELRDPRQQKNLMDVIESIRPRLLVLDPLIDFLGGANENDASDTAFFRLFCNKIINTYETSLIVIHHAPKGREDIRGSTAWWGWADAAIHFSNREIVVDGKPHKSIMVKAKKMRNGPTGKLFEVIPEIDPVLLTTTFAPIPDDAQRKQYESPGVARAATYHAVMRIGPCTQDEISKHIKLHPRRVKIALQELKEAGYVLDDAQIARSTGDGRRRKISAWRATGKTSHVDIAAGLMNTIRQAGDDPSITIDFAPYDPCSLPVPMSTTPPSSSKTEESSPAES
ncbi:MAG: hypothetical protein D6812_07500 [Deltaproteobacteria bacterium]|nr:MAG: hypothetical protein D6812_07500 [Deltaproteobacteria bacterium]